MIAYIFIRILNNNLVINKPKRIIYILLKLLLIYIDLYGFHKKILLHYVDYSGSLKFVCKASKRK